MQPKRPFIVIIIIILTLSTAWLSGLLGGRQVLAEAGVGNIGEEPERLRQIEQLLSHSPTGVNALTLMKQYGVKVRFAEGSGTIYRDLPNTIVIDLRHEPLRAALSLVHEMNHARFGHEGLRPDVTDCSRETYVQMRMQEEAESIALSLEARLELARAGIDVSSVPYPLEHEYEAALHSVKSNVPGMSEEDVVKYGRRAAKKLVFDALMSGEVRGSSSGVPYPVKFGQSWDAANALPNVVNNILQNVSVNA